ncbi:LuxR C-terminal-related transcriptional regulator [Spirillospora sp. CA-108201]
MGRGAARGGAVQLRLGGGEVGQAAADDRRPRAPGGDLGRPGGVGGGDVQRLGGLAADPAAGEGAAEAQPQPPGGDAGEGVEYRAIYAPEALAIPARMDLAREDSSIGERARILENPPAKLVIVDDEMALMPLRGDDPGITALIRPSTLLDILIEVFDTCWEQATPPHFDDESGSADVWPRLSDADRHLLTLLAAGLKDEAVARHTGMGARTVSRHVARLLRTLNARTRFQAGVHAARRGLV